jgi:isoaspartyl peptidase/L-asparaginase-like protein (Ntn-hydrolase superfamily)
VGSVADEVQLYTVREASDAELLAVPSVSQPNASHEHAEDTFLEVLSLQGSLHHDTQHRIACVAFSEDGTFLAACSTGALPLRQRFDSTNKQEQAMQSR